MTELTRFEIGAEAACIDGPCGEVRQVVIDPVGRTVTHLVIEAKHRAGLGKLVPVDLVTATAAEVGVRCTLAEFAQLEAAEETQFLPGSNGGYGGYGLGQAVSWPYFARSSFGVVGGGKSDAFDPVIHDTVPLGEVTARRGDRVHATDGEIGQVHGLVVDAQSHHVSHVLLQEGHLWGRKEVAVPIGAVASVDDGIRLNIAKQAVEDLPPVNVAPHAAGESSAYG